MSEVFIPPWIIPEEEPQEPLDEGSSVFRSAFAPGLAQRQSYGGLRLKLSRRHTVRAEEKSQLLAALRSTRGSYNALRTKVHFALRGSFPSSELLTNNTFSNGTVGWSAFSTTTSISAADRILRLTHSIVNGANGGAFYNSSAATVVQYAPYVLRAMRLPGSITAPTQGVGAGTAGVDFTYLPITTSSDALTTAAFVPYGTSVYATFLDGIGSGILSGAYLNFPYVSMSRCALVDNGSNILLQSDELDTSWTATRSSVDDQAAGTVAPDGTSTADSIIEDATAANSHFISQTVTVASATADYFYGVALKAGARTWALLQLVENTGSSTASASFDLGSGAAGTTSVSANWSNIRSFISPLGNGWYYCGFVARKANAATSVTARIYIAEADNDVTYNGDGTSNIYAWRATLAKSSVPSRLTLTTTVASTGASQTGSAMHIKGLPASTSGLLLPEDIFEINGEIKTCTAPLNSDAAGLGYLQFEPPLVRSPANSDPVIITDPMGKFLVSNIKIDNEFGTQAKVSYDLEHIYE